MPADDSSEIRTFQPLGDYDWPSRPTEEIAQRLWAQVLKAFDRTEPDAPLIEDAQLGQTGADRLDRIAAPPACRPVLDEMTATYEDWLADPGLGARLQVVVMPPCAGTDVVGAWARERDLAVLEPPRRALLVDRPGPPAPDLAGEGVLVLPRLERWFVRHEDGMGTLRALLAALVEADRPCLIGCDSWAWAYLARAADAALVLPNPYTFRAFDGPRLKAWFASLSGEVRAEGKTFRLADSGADLFAAAAEDGDDDAKEKEKAADEAEEFFERLAARSFGIPWIAWDMWRASISDFHPDEEDEEDESRAAELNGDDTFWISHGAEFTIPPSHLQHALLVLHALLIHGGLPEGLLDRTVPLPDLGALVPALVSAGLVGREGGDLIVTSAGYPSVRTALGNGGLPMDEL